MDTILVVLLYVQEVFLMLMINCQIGKLRTGVRMERKVVFLQRFCLSGEY